MILTTTSLRTIMLVLALDSTFAFVARRSMRIGALAWSKPPLAFSALPANRAPGVRRAVSNRDMTSFTEAEISKPRNEQTITTTSSLHTVMVKRNRQSAAFREGTPLVFGGSVSATFTEQHPGASNIDRIPMGSLVAVAVSKDSAPRKKDSKGRGSNSNSRNKEENVLAPHHCFSDDGDDEKHGDTIKQSQLIGFGVYNPESMYRVRILCHETMHPGLTKEIRSIRKQIQRGDSHDENAMLQLILEKKISDAIYTRLAMQLPSPTTDTYRLINGEGDGLSGLAVDILGGTSAIVMASAAWCEIHKDTILAILDESLRAHPSYEGNNIDIVWRNTPSRLKQDGYEVHTTNNDSDDDNNAIEKEAVAVISTESSVRYLTYPFSDGQKTGFYADQRENRLMIAELCQNKRVLDLCCYNGGFALNAMIRGSAASAIGVDSSQDAVDAATANAKLNGVAEASFVKNDIATFTKSAMDANDEFDVVVLDPPKLAPSLTSLDKASRKYHALNRDAMNLIDKAGGGLLLTCTCSAAMTQKDGGRYFLNMVNGAALSAKRRVTLLRVSGAAPCHTQSPASFPAGAYLTAALFHVGPADL